MLLDSANLEPTVMATDSIASDNAIFARPGSEWEDHYHTLPGYHDDKTPLTTNDFPPYRPHEGCYQPHYQHLSWIYL